MTTKTITQVATEPRIWEGGQHGPLAFIKVTFDDESQGDVACKPDNAENVIGILNGLKGKESDFQLEAKDDYNGIKQFKITGYPGKPGQDFQRSSGGGGGGGQRRHDPQTNASIEAQVAAKIAGELAVAYIGQGAIEVEADEWVAEATPKIAAAIRAAAQESGPASPPSGGPLPSPGPDKAEGDEQGAPASDASPDASKDLGWGTGPMTAKQKAILNRLYGNGVTKAAHEMFPEVTKVGDINETMAAALIEDKE